MACVVLTMTMPSLPYFKKKNSAYKPVTKGEKIFDEQRLFKLFLKKELKLMMPVPP